MTHAPEQNPAPSALRATFRRLLGMAAAWFLMGLMLGLVAGQGTGPIALFAALTAGVIVMTPVGLLLAAFGGRGDESLAGGMIGMILGVGIALLMGSDPRQAAAAGLVPGAVIGATVVNAFYRLPRFVAGRLFHQTEKLSTAD